MLLLYARVAELADAQDSGSCGQCARVGSTPISRTMICTPLNKAVFLLFNSCKIPGGYSVGYIPVAAI